MKSNREWYFLIIAGCVFALTVAYFLEVFDGTGIESYMDAEIRLKFLALWLLRVAIALIAFGIPFIIAIVARAFGYQSIFPLLMIDIPVLLGGVYFLFKMPLEFIGVCVAIQTLLMLKRRKDESLSAQNTTKK